MMKKNPYQRVQTNIASPDVELTRAHTHTTSIHDRPLNETDETDDFNFLDEEHDADEIEPEFTLVDTVPIIRLQSQRAWYTSTTFCYILLTFSLLVISTAGTLLKKLPHTPPLLRAFWRLFMLSLILLPPFLYQLRQLTPELRSIYYSRHTWVLITFSALSSAAHFGTWIWSLDHTSLSHSLFYVCASPLLMSLIFFARGTRINAKEWAGLVFGLIGSTLMLLDVRSEGGETADTNIHEPTFLGDFLAFLGAVTMVTYLLAGQSIRKQIPLFLYTFPMNLLSTIPLLICSYATENITLDPLDTGANAVFGFMNKQYVGLVLLIALGPGLIGHTGINYMIEHISPLIVSVALTLEPVLGIVVGMMFHEETTPALWTLLGGPLTVIGCILTIYGTHQRESYSTVQQSIQLTATNGIHHPLPSLHDFDEEEIHDLNDDPTITIERFQSSRSTADRRNGYGDSSTQAYDVHIKPSYEMNGGSHTAAMSISPPAAATHFDPHAEDVPEFDISERELLEMLSVQQTDEEIPTANGTHE